MPFIAQTVLFLVVFTFICPFAIAHMRNLLTNRTTFEKLRRTYLLRSLDQNKFFVSTDFVGKTNNENDVLDYEQASKLIQQRNIWDEGW